MAASQSSRSFTLPEYTRSVLRPSEKTGFPVRRRAASSGIRESASCLRGSRRIMRKVMGRAPKALSFETSHPRLGSSEEVRVGAYARRQLRRRIAIGLFGTVLIAGAIALYYQLRPTSAGSSLAHYPVRVRCVSCGHTAVISVPLAQTFPIRCPACGEATCREVWRCRACQAEFVPEQTGIPLRCPQCNSDRVGSAAAP